MFSVAHASLNSHLQGYSSGSFQTVGFLCFFPHLSNNAVWYQCLSLCLSASRRHELSSEWHHLRGPILSLYSMAPREAMTSSHAQIYHLTGSSQEIFCKPSTVLKRKKKKKGDSIKFSKMLDGRWKHLSDVFLCGTSKGEMSRLFLLLLSSCLRGKGNREEEYGAGLLGIFLSPIFLLKKEDQKFQIPRPSCLARPIQMLSVWIGSDQH